MRGPCKGRRLLNPDFAEMLRALSAAGAEYLLVGAYAMAAHGVPRAPPRRPDPAADLEPRAARAGSLGSLEPGTPIF